MARRVILKQQTHFSLQITIYSESALFFAGTLDSSTSKGRAVNILRTYIPHHYLISAAEVLAQSQNLSYSLDVRTDNLAQPP